MSAVMTGEELKSSKAEKALFAAMVSLLRKGSFRKLTIKGVCEEALISRATFYAHFIDKYDLLNHWLSDLWARGLCDGGNYDKMERQVNSIVRENMLILRNLLYDADDEAYRVLFNFVLSTINLIVEKNSGSEEYAKGVVLSNFYAAGIISYLSWQVNNKFPSDVPPMNPYLFEMIHDLQDWQSL